MRLLICDVETTGLEPSQCVVTELGAVLYDTDVHCILWAGSCIQPFPGDITQEIIDLTGITPEVMAAATDVGLWESFKKQFEFVARQAAAFMAHYAEFDESFIKLIFPELAASKPWICSKVDITFPKTRHSRSLSHIAVDHGLAIVQDHRALSDVLLICKMLPFAKNLDEQLANGLKPKGLFGAIVPFKQKDEAKSRGFSWDADRRWWTKRLPLDVDRSPTPDRPFALQLLEA